MLHQPPSLQQPPPAVPSPTVPPPGCAIPNRAIPGHATTSRPILDRAIPGHAIPSCAIPGCATSSRAIHVHATPSRAIPNRAVPGAQDMQQSPGVPWQEHSRGPGLSTGIFGVWLISSSPQAVAASPPASQPPLVFGLTSGWFWSPTQVVWASLPQETWTSVLQTQGR